VHSAALKAIDKALIGLRRLFFPLLPNAFGLSRIVASKSPSEQIFDLEGLAVRRAFLCCFFPFDSLPDHPSSNNAVFICCSRVTLFLFPNLLRGPSFSRTFFASDEPVSTRKSFRASRRFRCFSFGRFVFSFRSSRGDSFRGLFSRALFHRSPFSS